jgi:hypothetical protein
VYNTVTTTPTISLPNTGVGQAYELEWVIPVSNGAFTTGRINSRLELSVNGGAFNAFAFGGLAALNAVDTWPLRGAETYKAANGDTSIAARFSTFCSGGNYDSIASGTNPMLLRIKSTGLLSTEVA